jgi:hypothetical protein
MNRLDNLVCVFAVAVQKRLAKLKFSACGIIMEFVIADARAVLAETYTLDFIEGYPFASETVGAAFLHRSKIF